MRKENLIYYLLIWALMTVAYFAAVLFYFDRPWLEAQSDMGLFSALLLGGGFSLWFAIRYMDVGTKSTTQLFLSHLVSATVLALFLTTVFKWFAVSLLSILTEEENQRLVIAKLFVVYFFYALMLLNYYLLKSRDSLLRKEQTTAQLTALLQETQLNLLKSQLNPHFIFNSLNSISSLTVTDPPTAREMIVKLSSFLRYSLGNMKEELVTLQEELENLRLYTDIERTRFGERLQIEENIEPACLENKIPLLLLQPLMENAIKFGMYDNLHQTKIQLAVTGTAEEMVIELIITCDSQSDYARGKGIGLRNTKKRLEILFEGKHEFRTWKDNENFHVKIVFYT